jgi:hypothetical protein
MPSMTSRVSCRCLQGGVTRERRDAAKPGFYGPPQWNRQRGGCRRDPRKIRSFRCSSVRVPIEPFPCKGEFETLWSTACLAVSGASRRTVRLLGGSVGQSSKEAQLRATLCHFGNLSREQILLLESSQVKVKPPACHSEDELRADTPNQRGKRQRNLI